jgi:hypothetical protein
MVRPLFLQPNRIKDKVTNDKKQGSYYNAGAKGGGHLRMPGDKSFQKTGGDKYWNQPNDDLHALFGAGHKRLRSGVGSGK